MPLIFPRSVLILLSCCLAFARIALAWASLSHILSRVLSKGRPGTDDYKVPLTHQVDMSTE